MSTMFGVAPEHVEAVAAVFAGGLDRDGVGTELGAILGVGPAGLGTGVFRTATTIEPSIANAGQWHESQTADLPDWLAPFNGPRLVARDESGTVIASVGIKVHDAIGQELAVVTEEAARGRGLARTQLSGWRGRSGGEQRPS